MLFYWDQNPPNTTKKIEQLFKDDDDDLKLTVSILTSCVFTRYWMDAKIPPILWRARGSCRHGAHRVLALVLLVRVGCVRIALVFDTRTSSGGDDIGASVQCRRAGSEIACFKRVSVALWGRGNICWGYITLGWSLLIALQRGKKEKPVENFWLNVCSKRWHFIWTFQVCKSRLPQFVCVCLSGCVCVCV